MKPSIRKQDGRWRLERPGYGFSHVPTVTVHETWRAARDRLLGGAVGSAGPTLERASAPYAWRLMPRSHPAPWGPVPTTANDCKHPVTSESTIEAGGKRSLQIKCQWCGDVVSTTEL